MGKKVHSQKKIYLSLNPTYLCNFRCEFCYLSQQQLADSRRISIQTLKNKLREISLAGYSLEHVDIYGGEIALLDESYVESLDEALLQHGDPTINVVTNLSKLHPFFLKDHVTLSSSYDFEAREKHEIVFQNMMKLNKRFSILMLASAKLLAKDVDEMISCFNIISNLECVEVKPYSENQANQLDVNFDDFEEFIKRWIKSPIKKRFSFINEKKIINSLKKKTNAYSDDHIYLTPSGSFAVLEFDKNDKEFFLNLNSMSEYEAWSTKEKKRVQENLFCQDCQFLGHCLTEHYREVKSLDNSCNGFKNLLTWYEDEILV